MKKVLSAICLSVSFFAGHISFSQEIKDTYKVESDGYFVSPQLTSFGAVATNNFGSKIYIVKDNVHQVVVALPGCGRYFTLSDDKSKVGFKYVNGDGDQVPAVYDLTTGQISDLANPMSLCGQVSFSNNGSVAYTVGNQLNIIQANSIKTVDLGTYSNIAPISPDGNFALFNTDDDQLYIIDLISNEKRQITDGNGGYAYPKWSPDGDKVLYSSLSGNLFVWERNSNNTYSLGAGKNACWSGDSQSILFDRAFIEGFSFKGSDVFMVAYNGSNIINITNTPDENEMYPSFGDGNAIVYSAYGQGKIISATIDFQNAKLISKTSLTGQTILLNNTDHYSFPSRKNDNPTVAANKIVAGTVPYVNQVYDTPNWHNGHASCAPSTAIMALGYYNKLPYWDINCSSPSAHVSHYGAYIADIYNCNEVNYSPTAADWGGNTSWGGYGYMWNGSYSPNSRMATYFQNHGVNSVQSYSTVFSGVTSQIDQNKPFPICNMLTSYGHLTLAIGYVIGQHTIIFHDPYGNKNSGAWPNFYGANSYYDWPGYNNGYQNLNSIAWTVTAESAQTVYNDTIIDDTYYNNGFYMHNQGAALMQYFKDKKTGGYNSHFWYTVTSASTSTDTCYVKWTADIPSAGNYNVYAYIPATNATTTSAKYKVYYSGGNTTVTINQLTNNGQWVSLGVFAFAKGTSGYVRLGDATGIGGKHIAFDAVKWVREGAIDNTDPTTSISAPSNWVTQNFTVNFTDADNSGGSGLEKSLYHVVDYNGTEWRANPSIGFFRDNFDNAIHSDWTTNTGSWAIVGGVLEQSNEGLGNTNISAPLTQNLSNRYLYNWSGKIEGTGTNKRAGIHFMCDNATGANRGNSYLVWFRVDQNQVEIYKSVNDVLGTPQHTAPIIINAGTFYDYKVVYDRSTGIIDVYLNNSLVTSWTDSSPLTTGSYVSFRNGDSKFSVNNFYVYRSRNATVTVNVGTGANDAIRYQNPSPTQPSGMIKSIVMDVAGNLSTVASKSVDVDWTTPSDVAVIRDGTGSDINVTASTTQLSANWDASADVHSDVVKYYYAIGTTAGATDVVNWTSNGLSTSVTKTGLNLTVGQMYYFSIKAENGAGLQSAVMSSDGQMVQISTGIQEDQNAFNLNAFPNPFNDKVIITFQLKEHAKVELTLFDLLGKEITVYKDNSQTPGIYQLDVNAKELNLQSGVYILQFKTAETRTHIKLIRN